MLLRLHELKILSPYWSHGKHGGRLPGGGSLSVRSELFGHAKTAQGPNKLGSFVKHTPMDCALPMYGLSVSVAVSAARKHTGTGQDRTGQSRAEQDRTHGYCMHGGIVSSLCADSGTVVFLFLSMVSSHVIADAPTHLERRKKAPIDDARLEYFCPDSRFTPEIGQPHP